MAAEVTISIRVPADLADQAKQVARSRDETMSQVVRRALKNYVGRSPRQLSLDDVD
jgi:predicted transcriptional regulator